MFNTLKLASLLVLAAPLAASAAMTMSATSSGVQYTITDLQPGDGVATGLSNQTMWSQLVVWDHPNPSILIQEVVNGATPTTISSNTPLMNNTASMSGPIGVFQHTLSTTDAFEDSAFSNAATAIHQLQHFTVAPQTRVTVTGRVNIHAVLDYEPDGARDPRFELSLDCHWSQRVQCTGISGSFSGSGIFDRELAFTAVFQNTLDTAADGYFSIASYLDVYQTPAVPEPSMLILLAGGLPLAGIAMRRRARSH